MSIFELCERVQDAGVSRAISESTWGYPIAGALHVLVIALFGGAVLIPHLRVFGFAGQRSGNSDSGMDIRWIRGVGLMVVVLTGTILFASSAARYYESTAFRVKLVLLGLIVVNAAATSRRGSSKLNSGIALALWAAVIFASRGIAFL